jgi:hypothetical protein
MFACAALLCCRSIAQSTVDLPSAPQPSLAAAIDAMDVQGQTAQNSDSAGSAKTNGTATPDSQTSTQKAAEQLKQQEHQRILGVVPNFNTVLSGDAAPLNARQKWHLAYKSMSDPFELVAAGLDAGISQADDDFPGYGQGGQGYAKRYGASLADAEDSIVWGNAILPILFKEDPRYFRKGTGSFSSRAWYSFMTTFKTRTDRGTYTFNYGNVLGNFIAGGISNAYYPSTDRGFGLTMENASTVTMEGAIGAEFVEFWPDISQHLFKHKNAIVSQPHTH